MVYYAPQLEAAFRKPMRPAGKSWQMDETYIQVCGTWCSLYRAVDDDMLSELRERAAALRFFNNAIGSRGIPEKVTIDKSGANTAALDRINGLFFIYGLWQLLIKVRGIKYLNNRIEQDHRGIKNVKNYRLGFKSFTTADATIAKIKWHQMLKKGQMLNSEDVPAWKQFYKLAA